MSTPISEILGAFQRGDPLETANGFMVIGEQLARNISLDPAKWYRVATLPATNTGQEIELHIRQAVAHANTVVKLSKGTGRWRAEVYRAGFYIPAADNYPAIDLVRIVDMGVNQQTHIDIKVVGNSVSQGYSLAFLYNIGQNQSARAQLVDFTDMGSANAGVVFQAAGTIASWGNNAGQLISFIESGAIIAPPIYITNNVTLTPNTDNHIQGGTDRTLTLPVNAPAGSKIRLTKELGRTVYINRGGSELIKYNGGTDTQVIFDIDAEIVFIRNSNNQWEI